MAGLAQLGKFVREVGLDAELKRRFGNVKTGRQVVYPMPEQLRLLLDAQLCGESRVLGLEALAADALFVHLAGGTVPSIDTVYRDLCRFDAKALASLEDLMAAQSFALIPASPEQLHLDIDTTVDRCLADSRARCRAPTRATTVDQAIIRCWQQRLSSEYASARNCVPVTEASARATCRQSCAGSSAFASEWVRRRC